MDKAKELARKAASEIGRAIFPRNNEPAKSRNFRPHYYMVGDSRTVGTIIEKYIREALQSTDV